MTEPLDAGPLDTEPIDDLDLSVLERIAALTNRIDPPPSDLDDRVHFVLRLDRIEFELARVTAETLVGTGARAAERTRTITFEADSRTVMITIVEGPDGRLRVDGWLAPAAPLRVELRFPEPEPARFEVADAVGRFVFEEVGRGLAQLLVHAADDGGSQVVTPSFAL